MSKLKTLNINANVNSDDAYIFFDDVDSNPYMSKQRKDSVNIEIANREIYKLLEAISMILLEICSINFVIE